MTGRKSPCVKGNITLIIAPIIDWQRVNPSQGQVGRTTLTDPVYSEAGLRVKDISHAGPLSQTRVAHASSESEERMTVKDLIQYLAALPQETEVVVDKFSEMASVEAVVLGMGYDNGGYVSSVYSDEDALRAHTYVFLGADSPSVAFTTPWSERKTARPSVRDGYEPFRK